MCGVLVTTDADTVFHHRMLGTLRKRGPDGIGFWTDRTVHMAHTRLAIIGLDERASEPLENERFVLVYNGEIYNFQAIKLRLESEGVPVRGANDAEVLLHAWTRWGSEVLQQLVGFWAFVLYDKQARTLTLVRDQLGIKPLYYWCSKQGVRVASTLRTLLDVTKEPFDLDFSAMSEYVRYQFTFGDRTFVKQVRKVLPGHMVTIDLASHTVTDLEYEDILTPPQGSDVALTPEWMEETRALIAQCVLESTVSDTAFTTFCSGGLDSSLITALTRPEVAYHCNYTDSECNETFFAQQVVDGTATRLFVVNAQESFDLVTRLDDILEDFDELTIGSVILPLDDLLAQVKRRYKVILTGSGGDELFAGYVRYQLALGQCYQDSYRMLFAKMRKLESAAARFELSHRKGDPSFYRFYDSSAEQSFIEAYERCKAGSTDLHAMLRFDRRYFLPGLLNIDDKMSGRHSLESRPSLLHQRLVRHLLRLDPSSFLRGGDLKPLLRDLAADRLPKAITQRTDKMGFTTPIGTFVNESAHLIREQLSNSRFRDLYDIRKMKMTAETKFSREVFGLLMLDLWLNRYARR